MDLSWQNALFRDNMNFVKSNSESPEGNAETLNKIRESLEEPKPYLKLTGDGLSETTALMAKTAAQLMKEGANVIPFFFDASKDKTDMDILVRYFVYSLENLLGKTSHFGEDLERVLFTGRRRKTAEDWFGYLNELIEEYTSKFQEPLYFFIDGENRFDLIFDPGENLLFLTGLPEGVKLIGSDLKRKSDFYNTEEELEIIGIKPEDTLEFKVKTLKNDRNTLIENVRKKLEDIGIEFDNTSLNNILRLGGLNNPIIFDMFFKLLKLRREEALSNGKEMKLRELLKDLKRFSKNPVNAVSNYIKALDEAYPEKKIREVLDILPITSKGLDARALEALMDLKDPDEAEALVEFLKDKLGWLIYESSDGRIQVSPFYRETLKINSPLSKQEIEDYRESLFNEMLTRPDDDAFKLAEFHVLAARVRQRLAFAKYVQQLLETGDQEVLDRLAFEVHQFDKFYFETVGATLYSIPPEDLSVEEKLDIIRFLSDDVLRQAELDFLASDEFYFSARDQAGTLEYEVAEETEMTSQLTGYILANHALNGYTFLEMGNLTNALPSYEVAVDVAEKADEEALSMVTPLIKPIIQIGLADTLSQRNEAKKAQMHYKIALLQLEDLEKTLGKEVVSKLRNEIHDKLAEQLDEKQIQELLADKKALSEEELLNEIEQQISDGAAFIKDNEFAEAELSLSKIPQTIEENFDCLNATKALALLARSYLYRAQNILRQDKNDYANAKDHLLKAEGMFNDVRYSLSSTTGWRDLLYYSQTLNELGNASLSEDLYDEARKFYQESYDIMLSLFENNDDNPAIDEGFLQAMDRLANLAMQEGEDEKALFLNEKIRRRFPDSESYRINFIKSFAYNRDTIIMTKQKRYDEALDAHYKAIELQNEYDDYDDDDESDEPEVEIGVIYGAMARTWKILGDLYFEQGLYSDAREFYGYAFEDAENYRYCWPSAWDDDLMKDIEEKRAEMKNSKQ